MTVRKILSARSARPQVEALLRGLVRAAVYMARADGQFGEAEVESLIDSVREVVVAAIGEEYLQELASAPHLLDWARDARRELLQKGEAAYLADLASRFEGGFRKDALIVAYRIIAADGTIAPDEAEAFRKLSLAMGFQGNELDALESMASSTAKRAQPGRDEAALASFKSLYARGWSDPFAGLRASGIEVAWYDASAQHRGAAGWSLRLDLDAQERSLHLHFLEGEKEGPHLLLLYGERFDAVLDLIDGAKAELSPVTFDAWLPRLVAVCPDVFLERDGRLMKLVAP